MFSTLRLHASNPAIEPKCTFAGNRSSPSPAAVLRLQPPRRFTVLSFQSPQSAICSTEPSVAPEFSSSVGSPPVQFSQLTLTQGHINVLYVAACAVAISTTWLFCSAIPTLLSFKRAAESLEKLMDVTRDELPGTMAAVRLSGMEISDLTMELSDLGQEITQGVRSSTRAVRMAEERLRRFANVNSTVPMQEVVRIKTTTSEPVLARSARGIKEGIGKSRAVLQMFFTVTRFSKLAINYLSNRSRRRALNK